MRFTTPRLVNRIQVGRTYCISYLKYLNNIINIIISKKYLKVNIASNILITRNFSHFCFVQMLGFPVMHFDWSNVSTHGSQMKGRRMTCLLCLKFFFLSFPCKTMGNTFGVKAGPLERI